MECVEQVAQQVPFAWQILQEPLAVQVGGGGGGWPLSGWGLWWLVDLQGADPRDGRPGALGLSQIRRTAQGGPAEVTVWWLEVASRPKSSTPSWCLSRGPSDTHQAPSWSSCGTPGTQDAQSQGRAVAGLQQPPFSDPNDRERPCPRGAPRPRPT